MARYIDADKIPYYLDSSYEAPMEGRKVTFKSDIDKIPTADVVPKSEVEELSREYESLAKTVNEASELIRKLRINIYELKKDRYQVLPDGRIELIPRTDIDEIKSEVAREIFEEIERFLYLRFRFCKEQIGNDDTEYVKGRLELNTQIQNFIAELKEKYTE
jgi:hypothetical protein